MRAELSACVGAIYRLVQFPAGEHEELVAAWLWSELVGVVSHQTALALHGLSDVEAAARSRAPVNPATAFTPSLEPIGCGDYEVHDGEQCDDGNQQSGDGCSATCNIETGWHCYIAACYKN